MIHDQRAVHLGGFSDVHQPLFCKFSHHEFKCVETIVTSTEEYLFVKIHSMRFEVDSMIICDVMTSIFVCFNVFPLLHD